VIPVARSAPSVLVQHAAVILATAFALSIAYELWRATRRAGASPHDSVRAFVVQLPVYALAAVVVALMLAGVGPGAAIGLALALVGIAVSFGYYNPRILPARGTGVIDLAEDLAFTSLLCVAAALLGYEVLGWSLT
jgi:hypothetical protein